MLIPTSIVKRALEKPLGAALLLAAVAAPLALPWAASADEPNTGYTTDFRIQDCEFATSGINPHFILLPGYRLVLEGEEENEEGGTDRLRLVITVKDETRRIAGVLCRVVEERETKNGELVEVSRNFYALCKKTSNVFYFGEEVDIYEDGEIVSHEGAWQAGRRGARPGVIMPGSFLLGSRYFQEIAPPVALDRAEHIAMGLTVETPFAVLRDCVEVLETSPLEPGAESVKMYAPGIGLIVDGPLRLVDVILDADDDDDESEAGRAGDDDRKGRKGRGEKR
jgi:hypothetical protein